MSMGSVCIGASYPKRGLKHEFRTQNLIRGRNPASGSLTIGTPMAPRTYHRLCPLSMALEDVGDRWTLHIVYALLGGPKRYADLKAFLAGAGSNVLGDRLRQLADAQIVRRVTGDRPGSDVRYQLTDRGLALAPVVQALVRWGMASLTLTAPSSGPAAADVFDQAWAIPDAALVADETYEWTVDGVRFELAVTGRSVTRTPGPAHSPVVTLTATSVALDSVLAGERTLAAATAAGDVSLTGSPEAIGRMFTAIGFPAHLLGADSPDRR
jgi:DNA-binding HxlR family transcriptional regulator